VEEIQTCQRKWKEHVERMQDDRPPKLALKYQPVGKRNREVIPKRDEKPVLGRELKNTGSISLFPCS
jgi:hypothetical protein